MVRRPRCRAIILRPPASVTRSGRFEVAEVQPRFRPIGAARALLPRRASTQSVRCSDSLSLREFLRREPGAGAGPFLAVTTRTRLPHEVHTAIFDWVLALIAEAGLVKGDRIGVDPRQEANAALRTLRRDTGEGYRGMLERLAQESGIETPRPRTWRVWSKRKGKKLSNQDWVSRSDPEAKIKMKDGTTHAYKPEPGSGLVAGCTPPTRATRLRFPRRLRQTF